MSLKEINEETFNQLISDTPFRLPIRYRTVMENGNANCTHSQIDSLLCKRLLNPIDMEIVKLLATYRFLNAHNIMYYLNELSGLDENYKKECYTKNLGKLFRSGILARYCLTKAPTCGKEATEGPVEPQPTSPLRFYDLTPGAYSYISPSIERSHNFTAATDDVKRMELLALNQFLLRFQRHYCGNYALPFYLSKRQVGSKNLIIDALIDYQGSGKHDVGKRLLSIFVLTTRQTLSLGSLMERLRLSFAYINRHYDEFPSLMLLLLVEDLEAIIKIYVQMQTYPDLMDKKIYFIPDALVNVYPPLECIYSCKRHEGGRTCATRFKVNI